MRLIDRVKAFQKVVKVSLPERFGDPVHIITWTGLEYSKYHEAVVALPENSRMSDVWPDVLALSLCDETGAMEIQSIEEAREIVRTAPGAMLRPIMRAIWDANGLGGRDDQEEARAEKNSEKTGSSG